MSPSVSWLIESLNAGTVKHVPAGDVQGVTAIEAIWFGVVQEKIGGCFMGCILLWGG